MPRVNFTRTDRIAQMSMQEQLIAQKRQQILEKQRTLQMAKQIAAEATKTNPVVAEAEPEKSGGVRLPFINDGSFLENFKKLSEKFAKTNEDQTKRAAEDETANSEKKFKAEEPVLISIPPPPPPPPNPPVPPAISALPIDVAYATFYDISHPPPVMPLHPAPLPPSIPCVIEEVRPTQQLMNSLEVVNQPQQPLQQHMQQLTSEVVLQQPSPQQLLMQNAQPEIQQSHQQMPQSVQALHVHDQSLQTLQQPQQQPQSQQQSQSQQQQLQQPQQQLEPKQPVIEPVPEVAATCKVFSENDKLPTTVEELVELVADIGDVYEEKLSSRKNELHPSLWFLFDKQSEAYRNYRHMIVAKLFKSAGIEHALPTPQQLVQTESTVDDSKYDPADVLDDTNIEDDCQVHDQLNEEPIQMQPNYYGDERHFYDDKSTTETDSDTEYVREARKRNLKNLKRKTMNAGNPRDESSTDTDDDFGESSDNKQETQSEKNNNSGTVRSSRPKHRKKSRWGEQTDSVEMQDLKNDSKGSADGSQNSATSTSGQPAKEFRTQQQPPHSRTNPGFLQFVFQNFGTVEVSPESWKKAEEHFRIRLLYEDMSNKIQTHERYISNRSMGGSNVSQADIEEDHKLTAEKMQSVLVWINEITNFYDQCGSPSLEEFLMRDEYETFLEKYSKTNTNQPDIEDYKKFKLEQAKIVSTNSRGEYSSTDSESRANKSQAVELQANADQLESAKRSRTRKSRWGDQVPTQATPNISATTSKNRINQPSTSKSANPTSSNYSSPKLTAVSRTDPALLTYVRQNFGTTNLSEEDWKKAEDHFKINLLYQDMLKKRQEIDRLAAGGKFKYEYDSDEDTTGGTWEHKLRSQEMEATQLWANELTKKSEGKHHIGDFLPPEELRKFMEKYEAQKNNRQPNLSDYKEYKLKEDNVGFQMLQKLGWKAGQGLGADGSGIVDPINKAAVRDSNQGLGASSADNPEIDDNEYDAYRKRMMLAYRFRPNPLNNPRRAYY